MIGVALNMWRQLDPNLDRSPVWERAALTGICGYECIALWHPWLPPITKLVGRRPLLGGVLVGALTWHFLKES